MIPLSKLRVLREINGAVALIHRRQVDFGVKFDCGRLRGVVRASHNVQKVDSVVKVGVRRSHNRAIPVRK